MCERIVLGLDQAKARAAMVIGWIVVLAMVLPVSRVCAAAPPNVLLVITDDQGFGDLGIHGNPVIKTPQIDAFARKSVWLKNFYVCPVCSPTRSSLLTGQYNYRTGIVDTYLGRSLMRPDIPTLPEWLASAGYRTGLFGKWHLGDNYPLRPEDRGFQETLWSQGGGLAQPSDSPQVDPKTAYFDPVLKKNGKEAKTKGYCTDVFTDAAIEFLSADSSKPFFAYVAYNCPHAPYQVPKELAAPYAKLDLTASGFPKIGQPWATGKVNADEIAGAYGMIENIDANFARLLKTLKDKKLTDNTIVIFMTDNGTGGVRYNAGLRNRKGTVYEGGIRVPCYVWWPGIKAGATIDSPTAHIDIAPTLIDLCGVKLPDIHLPFDGQSLAVLLRGTQMHLQDRTLFFQWHRGYEPEKYRSFAARGQRYKLVQAAGAFQEIKGQPKFELFDIVADPFEERDLATEKPDELAKLKKQYEVWFADVTKAGFTPPRIVIGSDKENPVRLSRQDWRGPKAGWDRDSNGHWEVKIERSGQYKITLWSPGEFEGYSVTAGDVIEKVARKEMKDTTSFHTRFAAGPVNVEASVTAGKTTRGVTHVELEYVGK
ncbi:MAG TPA: arylsulfatase [Gemmata sp.]|jgi:arylsulfatase A-like enzyme|nr:arylsulfatase [Gemmata sp.]